MSNTPRKKKLIAALLLLPLWLPVLLYTGFEWFIDPFPNSIWALRVLNTNYLVHVRADLTIDSEPLVMERIIRCYEPVDYAFLVRRFGGGGFVNKGNAGDNIVGISNSGRVFIISLPDICDSLLGRYIEGRGYVQFDPENADVPPLRLTKKELNIPALYEVFGGRAAPQVDWYAARDQLLAGYQGVKLVELLVEKAPMPESPWSFLKDWNGYEWFGTTTWIRPFRLGVTRKYHAGYLIPVPRVIWENLGHWPLALLEAWGPDFRKKMEEYVKVYQSFTEDTLTQGNEKHPEWALFQSFGLIGIFGPDSRLEINPSDIQYADFFRERGWIARSVIPCLYDVTSKSCDAIPERQGILRFTYQAGAQWGRKPDHVYNFEGESIVVPNSNILHWYRHRDGMVFVGETTDSYLGDN